MVKAAVAWSTWEGRIFKLIQDPAESLSSSFADPQFAVAFARLENHYFMNDAFFPRDGFLLEKKNIDKIKNIPTVIIQGRYDICCPPLAAHTLHKALPNSEIRYVFAGHSAGNKETVQELLNVTEKFKKNN
jgi:proline iminopeptidase